jgi:hypothetical protein
VGSTLAEPHRCLTPRIWTPPQTQELINSLALELELTRFGGLELTRFHELLIKMKLLLSPVKYCFNIVQKDEWVHAMIQAGF